MGLTLAIESSLEKVKRTEAVSDGIKRKKKKSSYSVKKVTSTCDRQKETP